MIDHAFCSDRRQYWMRFALILAGIATFFSLSLLMRSSGRTSGFPLIGLVIFLAAVVMALAYRPRDVRISQRADGFELSDAQTRRLIAFLPFTDTSELRVQFDGHVLGLPLLRLHTTCRGKKGIFGKIYARKSFNEVNDLIAGVLSQAKRL